jgi:hypothetical protein
MSEILKVLVALIRAVISALIGFEKHRSRHQ